MGRDAACCCIALLSVSTGCWEPCSEVAVYVDVDLDGAGDSARVGYGCADKILTLDEGFSFEGGDCDDADHAIHPAAQEACDGVDNNCDGEIDEGVSTTYYADFDQDSFGSAENALASCDPGPPEGYQREAGDCDDTSNQTFPGAAEAESKTACMRDVDGDGYGDRAPPTGVEAGADCDDSDNTVLPGAAEVCDSVDNDCDGRIDTDDDGVQDADWYADTDEDGYGDPEAVVLACLAPSGHTRNSEDCDDTDAGIHPAVSLDGAGGVDRNCSTSLEDVPTVWGPSGGRLGVDLAIADFDGDGQDDLLAGAYLAGSTQHGSVYLLYGPLSGGAADEAAQAVLHGEDEAHAGIGIGHWPADIDGDGLPEAAFGADSHDTLAGGRKAGRVSVLFSGERLDGAVPDDSLLHIDGDSYDARLGRGLAFVGDLNGDHVPELFVAARDHSDEDGDMVGAGFLLSGSALAAASREEPLPVSDEAVTLWGVQAGSLLGYQGAVGADVDGDGANDLITSAFLEENSLGKDITEGSVYLASGPVTADQRLGESDTVVRGEAGYLSRLGSALAAADLDRDGYTDAVVGALGSSGIPGGRVWVVSGDQTASRWRGDSVESVASASIYSTQLEAGVGSAVEILDANGDLHPDLVVGAKYWGATNTAGAVFVFYGPFSGAVSTDAAAVQLERSLGYNTNAGEVLAVSQNLLGTPGPAVAVGASQDGPDDEESGGNGAVFLMDLSP